MLEVTAYKGDRKVFQVECDNLPQALNARAAYEKAGYTARIYEVTQEGADEHYRLVQ